MWLIKHVGCILRVVLVTNAGAPKFRILAPPIVCPKNNETLIEKPHNTIITLQTYPDEKLQFSWTVRWHALPAPTQMFTLALWRSVRRLEAKLNGPQPEPYVYDINYTELLPGVNYIFNVTGTSSKDNEETLKSFHIDNIRGEPKLLIEGRVDMFAVLLVGGQDVYPDMEYNLDAEVTACYETQDYYFVWSVKSEDTGNNVNVEDIKGSHLVIPQNTLYPGNYDVVCQVFKFTNRELITQTSLPFRTLHRNVKVYLAMDLLVVTVNKPFSIQAITNFDYSHIGFIVTWTVVFYGKPFLDYEDEGNMTVSFPSGLPNLGEYIMSVTVDVRGHPSAVTSARLITTATLLPLLQIQPIPRYLNEGTLITMIASIHDIYPECSVAWYFADEACSSSTDDPITVASHIKHGNLITESLKFNSLEESFLSELTDYSNDTVTATVSAQLQAAEGRVRLVAECGCSLIYNCTTMGTAYGDISFELNKKPEAGKVKISPESGIALERVFHLSTLTHSDPDWPLRYSFYCKLGSNETLLLGSHLEHLSIETLLPYEGGNTTVWVRVCDSLGACVDSIPSTVQVSAGEARTAALLIDNAQGHVRRCEMTMLQRLVMSAVDSYTNAGHTDALTRFSSALFMMLRGIATDCTARYPDQYEPLMAKLELSNINEYSMLLNK